MPAAGAAQALRRRLVRGPRLRGAMVRGPVGGPLKGGPDGAGFPVEDLAPDAAIGDLSFLPNSSYAVDIQPWVGADNRYALHDGLSDQQSVKRVTVVPG